MLGTTTLNGEFPMIFSILCVCYTVNEFRSPRRIDLLAPAGVWLSVVPKATIRSIETGSETPSLIVNCNSVLTSKGIMKRVLSGDCMHACMWRVCGVKCDLRDCVSIVNGMLGVHRNTDGK